VSAGLVGYNGAVKMASNRRRFFLLAAIMALLATAPAVEEASRPPLVADPVATYRPTISAEALFAHEAPRSPAFTLGLAETRIWASVTKIGPCDWFEDCVSQRKNQGYTLFGWQNVAGFSVDPYGVPAAYTDPTEVPDC
jgi:hypothetical protein